MKRITIALKNQVSKIRFRKRQVGRTMMSAYLNNRTIRFSYVGKTGHVIENVTARIIGFQHASQRDDVPIVELGVMTGGSGHPGYRKLSMSKIRGACQEGKVATNPSSNRAALTTGSSKARRSGTATLG